MIGQNDGVENERKIVSAFDGRQICVLTEYQQKFIKQMYGNADGNAVVRAKKIGGQGFKPDVEINIDGEKYSISVKKGGGNSVHQEKTGLFIYYCMQTLDMTEEERDSLLMFLYGDGTTDGDSLPEERLKDKELIETYKEEIRIAQSFLDRNKRSLLERFLIFGRRGKEKGIKADYLYHGDAVDGVWCPLDYDTIDYLMKMPNTEKAPLSIGPLTLQVWNRNLEGRPDMEERRHSIQVKWGSCKSHIEVINQMHLAKIKEQEQKGGASGRKRMLGDNRQGFANQDNLVMLMNNSRVSELPTAIRNIVLEMYPHVASSEIVHAMKITDNDVKPRISITVNGITKNLTVFMGSGNSVHQEKLHNFLEFCDKELKIEKVEDNALRYIMYGDGTLDGDSMAEERLPSTEKVKEVYENQTRIAQCYFDKNKRALIERFLVYGKGGKKKNIKADYIYYGTDVTGRIVSYSAVIEYLMQKEGSDSALLSLGSLTVQPWNRNPEAKPNLEERRHSLQVKWGGMKRDLSTIIENVVDANKGTVDGNWEEYELVSRLNRDKKTSNKLWAAICEQLDIRNLDDIYAIRVSNMVYSNLSDRMVLPKADVYLAKGELAHEFLLDNNYWLDEEIIEGSNLKVLPYSGISCKRPGASSFTYAKLTIKSFERLFGDKILGAAICLFVSEKDLKLNTKIIEAWGVSEQETVGYFSSQLYDKGINKSFQNLSCVNTCKAIKSAAIDKATQIIRENKDVSEAIFYGKGLFDEPYTASFIYAKGELLPTYVPEFSITTGSGRHKGIFTVVVKPS